jgi:hypothetical protein
MSSLSFPSAASSHPDSPVKAPHLLSAPPLTPSAFPSFSSVLTSTPQPPVSGDAGDEENIPPLSFNASPNTRKRKTHSVAPDAIPLSLSPERRSAFVSSSSAPATPLSSSLFCSESLPEELSHSIASSFAPSLSPVQYGELLCSMDSLVDKCFSMSCNAEFDRSYSLALQQAYKAAVIWNEHLEGENHSIKYENSLLKEKCEILENANKELSIMNKTIKEQVQGNKEQMAGKSMKQGEKQIQEDASVTSSYYNDYKEKAHENQIQSTSLNHSPSVPCSVIDSPSSSESFLIHRHYRDLLSESAELHWKQAQNARAEKEKFLELVRKSCLIKEKAYVNGKMEAEKKILELNEELTRAKVEIQQLKAIQKKLMKEESES